MGLIQDARELIVLRRTNTYESDNKYNSMNFYYSQLVSRLVSE